MVFLRWDSGEHNCPLAAPRVPPRQYISVTLTAANLTSRLGDNLLPISCHFYWAISSLTHVMARFSMYPPSMLSSAALAHSAQEMQRENTLGDLEEFSVNELISRLQILTRVENVSTKLQSLPLLPPVFCWTKHHTMMLAVHDLSVGGCFSAQTSFIDRAL